MSDAEIQRRDLLTQKSGLETQKTKLETAKAAFESSVNGCIDKFNEAAQKVADIEAGLSSTEDTDLNQRISAKIQEIASEISNAISIIESKAAEAYGKIDDKLTSIETEISNCNSALAALGD